MGIKEIQAVLKNNFDVYANVRVEMMKKLEEEHGRLFVHFGQDGYDDWYYCLDYGIISFGFSSNGRFITNPPEQHICLLEIHPCGVEDFEKAFNDALEKNISIPMFMPKEETIKWMRKEIQEIKEKK